MFVVSNLVGPSSIDDHGDEVGDPPYENDIDEDSLEGLHKRYATGMLRRVAGITPGVSGNESQRCGSAFVLTHRSPGKKVGNQVVAQHSVGIIVS